MLNFELFFLTGLEGLLADFSSLADFSRLDDLSLVVDFSTFSLNSLSSTSNTLP